MVGVLDSLQNLRSTFDIAGGAQAHNADVLPLRFEGVVEGDHAVDLAIGHP